MNIALLLSGGTGVRLGSNVPKQYIEISGRPVFSWCLEALADHEDIDGIQIVADSSWHGTIKAWWENSAVKGEQGFSNEEQEQKTIKNEQEQKKQEQRKQEQRKQEQELHKKEKIRRKFRGFSAPGENRQLSILHGLLDIQSYAPEDAYIFIHDAARPCLSAKQIADCIRGAAGHDGAMPVLPMKDTVYSSLDGKTVAGLLDRSTIYAGQAPEVFLLGKYLKANQVLLPEKILKINGSAEPAVMAGMDIAMIPGDEGNFKITTKADLERFTQIVVQACHHEKSR